MRGLIVGILILLCAVSRAAGVQAPASATKPAATSPSTQPALPPEPVPSEPADKASPRIGRDGQVSEYFMKMHVMFLQQRALGGIDLLFIGDMLIDNWRKPAPAGGQEIWTKLYAPLNAANFGCGADKTQNLLWRIDHGELDAITPKVVVLLIGTNNIQYPPDDILLGEMAVIQEIHQKLPNAKLLIIGLIPRGIDINNPYVVRMRDKIKKVNDGLAQLDDGQMTHFLDLGPQFIDDKGNLNTDLIPDGLHLNAKGYQVWAQSMQQVLSDMMR
jgi:lysophospholipase L1-like esterase